VVRQIYTDGRDWPNQDMRWPLMLGRSRGHWEGDTLVAETITMRPDMCLDTTPLMLSDKASVVERIRRIDDKTIENRVTIRDPVKSTHDWQFTRYYVRVAEGPEEWADEPELCGGTDDRNKIVDGKVTVQLPQQAEAGAGSQHRAVRGLILVTRQGRASNAPHSSGKCVARLRCGLS
jgi:hypothetical protein